jgi:hypothetical protein
MFKEFKKKQGRERLLFSDTSAYKYMIWMKLSIYLSTNRALNGFCWSKILVRYTVDVLRLIDLVLF